MRSTHLMINFLLGKKIMEILGYDYEAIMDGRRWRIQRHWNCWRPISSACILWWPPLRHSRLPGWLTESCQDEHRHLGKVWNFRGASRSFFFYQVQNFGQRLPTVRIGTTLVAISFDLVNGFRWFYFYLITGASISVPNQGHRGWTSGIEDTRWNRSKLNSKRIVFAVLLNLWQS